MRNAGCLLNAPDSGRHPSFRTPAPGVLCIGDMKRQFEGWGNGFGE